MSLTVKESGGDRKLPDPGVHVARCVVLIDRGTQQTPFGEKHQVLIGWELPEEDTYEWQGEERATMVWQTYSASLHSKSKLRHDLEAWRGRPFTPDELDGFSLAKVAGAPCQLSVVHSKCGQYANQNGVMALGKGQKCPPQITPTVIFDLSDPDMAVFDALSPKMQESIRNTPEFRALSGDPSGADEPVNDHVPDNDIPFSWMLWLLIPAASLALSFVA